MAPEMLDYLIKNGQAWVLEQRLLHRPHAAVLGAGATLAFEPFFGDEVLQSARFRAVPVIKNPSFYDELEAAGQPAPLDFSDMEGITFQDTVLISEPPDRKTSLSPGLLFHELVHVVQYRLLGVDEFVTRYVRGWAEHGYEYGAIPLERDAYELQEHYEMNPTRPFSVLKEVARRL